MAVDGTNRQAYTGKLSGVESLNDVVDYMENNGEVWENALDEYHSYSYNLQLLMVDAVESRKFLINEQFNLESIVNNGWPESSVKSIVIAETATTTEFMIQNLNVSSAGPGTNSTSRLVGTAKSLTFDIIQVGNTSLNDSIMNACMLCGYMTIPSAVFYLKINFKGFNESGKEFKVEGSTKVIPFKISNVSDVPTSTDARGTQTTIEGRVLQDKATVKEVNDIREGFQFKLEDTLFDSLTSFIDKLNEIENKTNFTGDEKYINSYAIELDPKFEEKFGLSPMNGPNQNTASAAPTVKKRVGNVNLSDQAGNIPIGVGIIDIIYDICIQSQLVRQELTTETPETTKVVFISPVVVPKSRGLNVVTGKQGHDVTYYVTFKETMVSQNTLDDAQKIENAPANIKKILEKKRCKKIYYYYYTGRNDQILDLQLSFNRQLQKAFVAPNNAYLYDKYVNGAADIRDRLNAQAREKLTELERLSTDNVADLDKARDNVESIKVQVENNENELSDFIMANSVRSIADTIPHPDASERELSELKSALEGKTLQQQIEIAKQYDPDLTQDETFTTMLENVNALYKKLDEANRNISNLTREDARLDKEQSEVYKQAIGAEISNSINSKTGGTLGENLKTIGNTSDIVLLEELESTLINSLSLEQFESILQSLNDNPVVFTNQVIPMLVNGTKTKPFTSSDEEDVELARQKFYEGVKNQISMQNLTMTIKGDPFWLDTYITPTLIRQYFDDKNALDEFRNLSVDLGSLNYLLVISNKSAGVDINDNVKIQQLETMLYAVRSVESSFSGGQFVQTLEMVKLVVPKSFKPLDPKFGPEIEKPEVIDPTGPGYATGDGTDPDAGDPRGNQIGDGSGDGSGPVFVPITTLSNPNNLPVGAGATGQVDANGNAGNQQSLDGAGIAAAGLNAQVINADTPPTGSQATTIQNLINQNKYLCDLGAQVSCDAVNRAYANMARGVEGLTTEEILEGLGDTEDLSPAGVALLQDSLENQGAETFNADDIPNANITQAQVDFARQEADDAAASYYIGNNGVVENPVDAMTDMETGGRFGEASAKDMLNGEDPYVNEGFERKMYADQTGRAPRSVDVDVDPKTLTPSEYEKVSEMNAEIVEITNGKSLYELTDAEWERVQQLENGINEISDASTSGVRGQVRDEVIDKEKRERISNLQDEREHLTDDLDGWYWTTAGKNEDKEQLAKVEQQLLAEQSTAQPTIVTDVQRIPNAQGEVEIVPVHTLKPIEDQPIVVPKTDPLPETYIDNRDGTITVLGPPSLSDTIPEEYAGMNEKQAREMSGARSIYNGIYEQLEDLPTVEDSITLDTGEVLTWENPDFSKLQEVEYVDANGETKTFDPSTVNWNTDGGWTPENQRRMMTTISDEFDDVGVSSAGNNNEVRGNVFSIDAPEENEEE